jgi:GT2 family glycosyltransferase
VRASLVVVSWRPGDWLEPCLRSALDQFDEVILVDNGSERGRASEIGQRAGARVLRSPANQGYAPAVNRGARHAKGELLAILNDDAMAPAGWLSTAARVLEDPSVAAVGPKLVFAAPYREISFPDQEWRAPGDPRPLGRQVRSVLVRGTEVVAAATGPGLHRLESDGQGDRWRWTAGSSAWYVPLPFDDAADEVLVDGEKPPPGRVVRLVNSTGAYLDKRGYAGDIGSGTPDDGRFDRPADRFALSAAAWVTRAETWRRLGGFAEPFFAYYEDIDWCWRAQLAGMRLVYDPAATVEHRGSASSGGEHDPWVRVTAERNRTLCIVRNGPLALAAQAVYARLRNGPDGGVRAGVARLLPWAAATRATMSRRWRLRPEEVWERWAGRDVT